MIAGSETAPIVIVLLASFGVTGQGSFDSLTPIIFPDGMVDGYDFDVSTPNIKC